MTGTKPYMSIKESFHKTILPRYLDEFMKTDLSDDFLPQDHIFELYRLSPALGSELPELYYNIYNKKRAETWTIYKKKMKDDIWNNVGCMVAAGSISTILSMTGVGITISAFAFATSSFLLSQLVADSKKEEMKNLIKSRTFWAPDSDRS